MKGFTLFLSITAVLAAGASAAFYWAIGNDKEQLARDLAESHRQIAQLEQRTTQLATARDELTARLQAIQDDVADTKARNTSLEARNAQLAREVTQMRDQLTLRERAEQSANRDLADLRRQLIDARAAAATKTGAATPQEIAAFEARILDLESELSDYRRRLGELPGSLADVPSDLTGDVIEVGPRSAFVVLNIGSRNGAVPSLEMVVRRGSTVVGRVRLTDVRDSYSVAHVLTKTGSGVIRTGDTASRS